MITRVRISQIIDYTLGQWYFMAPSRDWDYVINEIGIHYSGLERCIEILTLINAYQWFLEDLSRLSYTDPCLVGSIKYLIDQSNSRRVDNINMIDHIIVSSLSSVGNGKVAIETPGSVIDRLSILCIKRHNYVIAKSEESYEVAEQIHYLWKAINDLLDDLESGKQVIKVYGIKKIYPKEKV